MGDIMTNQFITLINKGYDKFNNSQTHQALDAWNEAYVILKDELKNEKISFLQLGNKFGFQPNISNWLKNINHAYIQNEQYDQAISYCQDIMQTFKDDKYLNDFRISIGHVLFLKNDLEQAYEYFESLLKKYPNDIDIIYNYLTCLKENHKEHAKDIILKYVPLSLEYNSQSEQLFKLSRDILNDLNEAELAKKYNNVNKVQNDFGKRKPVTKKVKVGRNDPCPCGSGKKYKKCCGK